MVWFKIDDGFWSHSKVLELSPEAGWLWTRAGTYCANQLTDGKVTKAALRMLAGSHDAATELVIAGLWDIDSDGAWRFHDWEDYQPTREEVLKDRAAAAERKRLSRERSRQKSQGESRRDVQGTDAVSPASPTRPDPTRPDLSSTSDEVEESGRTAPLSPFCSKHPNGTDSKCRACGTARMGFEANRAAEKNKPTPLPRRDPECPEHPGYPLPCHRCAEDRKASA